MKLKNKIKWKIICLCTFIKNIQNNKSFKEREQELIDKTLNNK